MLKDFLLPLHKIILSNSLRVETLWKRTVSVEFWVHCPNICGNCTFSYVYIKKLGETTAFCAVYVTTMKYQVLYNNIFFGTVKITFFEVGLHYVCK